MVFYFIVVFSMLTTMGTQSCFFEIGHGDDDRRPAMVKVSIVLVSCKISDDRYDQLMTLYTRTLLLSV
jgi:hypothetical protein